MDLADLMADSGVIQDPLSRRRFAGVDMSHDPDIPVFFEWGHSVHCLLHSFTSRCSSEENISRTQGPASLLLMVTVG
jgi:hypothetical protein